MLGVARKFGYHRTWLCVDAHFSIDWYQIQSAIRLYATVAEPRNSSSTTGTRGNKIVPNVKQKWREIVEEARSERTRVKRYHWLAKYDRATVHSILDAMPMCYVGYSFGNAPYVTPTMQWREGNRVFWHGSSASRMLRAVDKHDVCLTVSLLDGLVMARSAYNFNLNFRSVMIFGRAQKVEDTAEKQKHLETFVNRVIPGHWDRLRPVTEKELKATTLMSMEIDEASAKVRLGQPEDDQADYAFAVWAGVIPIRYEILPPIADPRNLEGVTMPEDVLKFRIG
jgi:hypothetical protein